MQNGTISTEDRIALAAHLDSTRDSLLALVAGMPAGQWAWQPPSEAWTVSLCSEHVWIVENSLFRTIQKLTAQTPEPERASRIAGKEKKLMERLPARQVKVQAPEGMRPTGRFSTPSAFAGEFAEIRNRVLSFVRETQDPVHLLVEPHFALGDLTAYQWLWFISAHCERHVNQMRETMALDGFPGPVVRAI